MDMQALIDGMSQQWQRERAATQMTLGKMIAALEALPANKEITGICSPHSYRGYYEDLAFEPTDAKTTVSGALEMCRSVMGKALTGYKGGRFVMGEDTPVWISEYGTSNGSERIMAIHDDGRIETAPDDDAA